MLNAAKEALGDNLKAVTIQSPYIPKWVTLKNLDLNYVTLDLEGYKAGSFNETIGAK